MKPTGTFHLNCITTLLLLTFVSNRLGTLNDIKDIPLNIRTETRNTTFSPTLSSFFPYFTVYGKVMLASLSTLSAFEDTNKMHEMWYEQNATRRGHIPFLLYTFVLWTILQGSHMYQSASFNQVRTCHIKPITQKMHWLNCLLWSEYHITHETATCHDPLIHNFTGDRKNFTDPQQTNTQAMFLWTQHFVRRCVCNPPA